MRSWGWRALVSRVDFSNGKRSTRHLFKLASFCLEKHSHILSFTILQAPSLNRKFKWPIRSNLWPVSRLICVWLKAPPNICRLFSQITEQDDLASMYLPFGGLDIFRQESSCWSPVGFIIICGFHLYPHLFFCSEVGRDIFRQRVTLLDRGLLVEKKKFVLKFFISFFSLQTQFWEASPLRTSTFVLSVVQKVPLPKHLIKNCLASHLSFLT